MATVAVGAGAGPRSRPGAERLRWVGSGVVLAVLVAWAVQRWSGTWPFGSDNDEYRLVAQELLDGGRPVVADVEGTKYPLGYPLVLAALDVVGLPVTRAALGLNLALLGALAAVVAATARSLAQRGASLPAALSAVTGAGIWGSAFVTMPDVAFVVVAAAVLWRCGRLRSARDVWVLAVLVVSATLLKSVGVLVAVAASVAVACAGPPVRRLAWAPAAGGLAVTAVTALLVGPHPEHTTGYARTFWLADPTDATRGRIGLLDLPGRLVDRAHLVLADLEAAVVGPHVARPWSWLLVAVLLVAGVRAVWGDRARRAHVLVLLAIWLPAMAVWPYASVRFQLPLVPLAALGVGWLAATAVRRLGRPVGAALVVTGLAASLWSNAAQVRRDAAAEAATVGRVADDAADAAAWATDSIPEGDVIASFAYREVAYRVERPVVPLGYTSDLERLAEEADAAGARWLVVMPTLYGARGGLERAFLVAHAERLRLAHATSTVEVYELLPG